MKAKDLMTAEPARCSPSDTLDHACRWMWERDCGAVPVVDDENHLVGMLTDRDATMAAWSRGTPMRSIAVDSVMNRDVVWCRIDDDASDIHDMMRKRRVRRVPVLDDERKVIGIVSMNDLVLGAARSRGKAQALAFEDVGRTLASVCEHTHAAGIRAVA